MKKVKNTIPVLDICSLNSTNQLSREVIAEPFGEYLKAHPNLHLAHRHSFFHIVLFTAGGGTHNIDFQQFAVAPGQIYFMKPGQVHSWSFEGDTDGFVINFSEDIFNHFLANSHYLEQFTFFQGLADECVINLEPDGYDRAKLLMNAIVTEVHHPQPMAQDAILNHLLTLFIIAQRCAARHMPATHKPQNQVLLQNFRKLVDAHFAEKRLPKDYASLLYITPNHLNALSNDLLGKSAGEVIRDRILLEAKRLLINADVTLSEIASALDFTDNSHFSRFFKKYTGLTPDGFRKDCSITNKQ